MTGLFEIYFAATLGRNRNAILIYAITDYQCKQISQEIVKIEDPYPARVLPTNQAASEDGFMLRCELGTITSKEMRSVTKPKSKGGCSAPVPDLKEFDNQTQTSAEH